MSECLNYNILEEYDYLQSQSTFPLKATSNVSNLVGGSERRYGSVFIAQRLRSNKRQNDPFNSLLSPWELMPAPHVTNTSVLTVFCIVDTVPSDDGILALPEMIQYSSHPQGMQSILIAMQ